jgi:L-seryl-tRNA(Ser) seleniumtransferase
MKVGKEGVVGAIAALEAWMSDDHEAARHLSAARLARAKTRLDRVPGLALAIEGQQLRLDVDAKKAGISAHALDQALLGQDPIIIVWSQFAREGTLMLTLGKLSDDSVDHICERISDICATGDRTLGPAPNIGDAIAAQMEKWPLSLVADAAGGA